ncbi:uncharacterized protein LOC112053747 [Bicyclus anynana]|uniref:Uncharacterized protein LOC112053747 n=1 Tax=Bicyclus anynana TaxID=110368 RepID=A0ABM3LSG5_BICAN|nr:uncharacterized protein LOC112053747 [Bicyclus anynana]
MCLSMGFQTANAIVRALRNLYPKVTYLKIPKKLQHLLPEWNLLEIPLKRPRSSAQRFVTRGNTPVELLIQRPGDNQSIYQTFASSKYIVLDVYGHSDSEYISSIWSRKYSVRNIDSISIKLPEKVIYINNMTDRMRFAVSTAADWQTLGLGPKQYWSCISNLDKEDMSGAGGDMLCVEDYRVWRTFDNLKVKEPSCIS